MLLMCGLTFDDAIWIFDCCCTACVWWLSVSQVDENHIHACTRERMNCFVGIHVNGAAICSLLIVRGRCNPHTNVGRKTFLNKCQTSHSLYGWRFSVFIVIVAYLPNDIYMQYTSIYIECESSTRMLEIALSSNNRQCFHTYRQWRHSLRRVNFCELRIAIWRYWRLLPVDLLFKSRAPLSAPCCYCAETHVGFTLNPVSSWHRLLNVCVCACSTISNKVADSCIWQFCNARLHERVYSYV